MTYKEFCEKHCTYGMHIGDSRSPKLILNSIYGRQATRKWAAETKDKDDGKKKRV